MPFSPRRPLAPLLRLLALILVLTGTGQAAELKKAVFIPQWEPQAQFAGFYVAKAKGFYRDRGVDLTILRGGPSAPPSKLLADGRAQFGSMFLASAIARRAEGLDLVNLAQLVGRSSLVLVAKKSHGIFRPEDLAGKSVSMWGPEFRIQLEAFFKKHGVRVRELPQGFTVNLFLYDGVDAASAMRYNEYHTILSAGLDQSELTVFDLAGDGLGFPEDGIYCLRQTLAKDPELCRAFVAASLDGWRYAFSHPDEALDIVMAQVDAANLPTNRVHQAWMLSHIKEAMRPDEPGFGELNEAAYRQAAQAMAKERLVENPPAYEDFRAWPR